MEDKTMKNLIIISVILAIFVACETTSQFSKVSKQQSSIKFYYGEVKTTSPDGKIPYGPVKYSLVKRTIDPANKMIIELVNQDEIVFKTVLTQTDSKQIFNVTDNKSFKGIITFEGKEWKWDKWTYDITMTDKSGKIIGSGELKENTLLTRKIFVTSDGTEQVLITEALKEISETEYNSKK